MNLQVLRQNLCEFGLNPNDWAVCVRRTLGGIARLEVRGRKGQAFGFIGWANEDQWLTLRLEI